MPVARSYTYYCLLLISIMSHYNCGPQDAENISERALEQLKEAQCTRALFLVIIMGLRTKLDYEDLSLKGREDIDLLAKGECIARVLSMPEDDCFGLSKSLISLIDPLALTEIYLFLSCIHPSTQYHVKANSAVDPDSSSAPLSKGEKWAKWQCENESAQDLVNEIKSSIHYKS